MSMRNRKNVAGGIAGVSFLLAALMVPIAAVWSKFPIAGAVIGALAMVFLYRMLRKVDAVWSL